MPRLKLTRAITDKAVELISDGVYIQEACQWLGVPRACWYEWLQKGAIENQRLWSGYYDDSLVDEGEYSLYFDFFIRTSKAEIELLRSIVKRMLAVKSVQHHWQHLYKFLQMRFQARWRENKDPSSMDKFISDETTDSDNISTNLSIETVDAKLDELRALMFKKQEI